MIAPKIDRLEVLERVKSDPGIRHIAIVVLTSFREEQDLVRSDALGATEFFNAIQDLGVFWAILNEPSPRPGRP